MTYGATDEVGWKAVEKRTHWNDFHATVLHIYHNGIKCRLTNVAGSVIEGILAS
jgi:hypothetical protein